MLTELARFREIILDESSTATDCRDALDKLALIFSEVGGVSPDPSFDGWREDSRLAQGVAINSRAAAHCIKDYQRSVMFIRGVHTALQDLHSGPAAAPLKVLYAGCGPFALLLLPLLDLFPAGSLQLTLLDIHQQSLDSVQRLLARLVATDHMPLFVAGDACLYQHSSPLDLVIVETMQKALEQEPQLAVTAQLAPQLGASGLFIPQRIEVELCLPLLQSIQSPLSAEGESRDSTAGTPGNNYPLACLLELEPDSAAAFMAAAGHSEDSTLAEIDLGVVSIPDLMDLADRRATLLTRIEIYGDHRLDYSDCELTLPSPCHELSTLQPGSLYRASYQLGTYPRIHLSEIA